MKIKLFAICGKAGSGKNAILKKLSDWYLDIINPIVSCTTRPPRESEKEGIDYFFLSDFDFQKKMINGELIESTFFNSWNYGTLKNSLIKNKINIGIFNPDGVRQLSNKKDIDLYIFYINATAKNRIKRQLDREINPNVDEIVRRYNADEKNFKILKENNYKNFYILNNNEYCDLDYIVAYIGQFCKNCLLETPNIVGTPENNTIGGIL